MITKRTIRKFKVALMAAILTPVGVLLVVGAATAVPDTDYEPSLRDIYEGKIAQHDEDWAGSLRETTDPVWTLSDASKVDATLETPRTLQNPQTPKQTCEDIGGFWDEETGSCLAETMPPQDLCESFLGYTWEDGVCKVSTENIEQAFDLDGEKVCNSLGYDWVDGVCDIPITEENNFACNPGQVFVSDHLATTMLAAKCRQDGQTIAVDIPYSCATVSSSDAPSFSGSDSTGTEDKSDGGCWVGRQVRMDEMSDQQLVRIRSSVHTHEASLLYCDTTQCQIRIRTCYVGPVQAPSCSSERHWITRP